MKNTYTNKKTYGAFLRAKEELQRTIDTANDCKKLYNVSQEQIDAVYAERIENLRAEINEENYQTELVKLKVCDSKGKLIEDASNEFYANPFQKIIGYFGMNGEGGDTYTVYRNSILDTWKIDKELTEVFNALFGGEQ